MRRSAFWAAAGAALIVIVATEAAAMCDADDRDGQLRRHTHKQSLIDPSGKLDCAVDRSLTRGYRDPLLSY